MTTKHLPIDHNMLSMFFKFDTRTKNPHMVQPSQYFLYSLCKHLFSDVGRTLSQLEDPHRVIALVVTMLWIVARCYDSLDRTTILGPNVGEALPQCGLELLFKDFLDATHLCTTTVVIPRQRRR